MGIYEGVIRLLETFGFFDIIAPFFLVWAVVYGILYKSKLIGELDKDERAKSIANVIAFSVALLTVGSMNITTLMKNVIPYIVFTILIVFSFILIIGILYLGEGKVELDTKAKKILGIIAGATFALAVVYSLGMLDMILEWISNPPSFGVGGEDITNIVATVVILAFMVGFVLWMTKPSEQKAEESSQQSNQ